MKKGKVTANCRRGQRPQRCNRWYHRNRERTNRSGSLRLGKDGARGSLSLTAGMTGRHHGASTLLRHVVAALPFRGSHRRTWKDAGHGWRDRP